MTDDDEPPDTPAHLSGYNPELEALKKLPASSRRLLVEELQMMAQESPEVAQGARLLMKELDPGEEDNK